jgi:hypothetical protein
MSWYGQRLRPDVQFHVNSSHTWKVGERIRLDWPGWPLWRITEVSPEGFWAVHSGRVCLDSRYRQRQRNRRRHKH